MPAPWPPGFERIPDDEWTRQPVQELALDYDTLEHHGWYSNLDPTVDELHDHLSDGDILVDYSGGTGILMERLLDRLGDAGVGLVVVDSSRKFLRLCLEKFADEPRVALRLLRYLRDEGRLQFVDEVVDKALVERGVDALSSTNAIHLYYDLPDTVASWMRVLRPGAYLFVQSGNIGHDVVTDGAWIIDETVHAVARMAERVVREDDAFAAYRSALDDEERMAAHHDVRNKFFLPVRPLSYYTETLGKAGFEIEGVVHRPIEARTDEWLEFLSVYHEGIIGWVGGTERVEGEPPGEGAVEDRLELMAQAVDRVFDGADGFTAEWTYITARTPM